MPKAARHDRQYGLSPRVENCSKPIDLVSVGLKLLLLVVILDTESSNNGKSIAAK